MGFGRRQPGDYAGLALYTIEGLWVVSVAQYMGWNKQDGHVWRSVPPERFFRPDVLTRQVAAANIPFTVEFREGRCLFKPTRTSGPVAPDGAAIKRFLNRNYSIFGRPVKPVDWSWEIKQYG